jgi:Uncharacterized conserved protein
MSEMKTCFKKVDYALDGLLNYIDIGDVGLPDIQRPFVWSNAKVRDLFDSMYRGFPVGYLLLWENAAPGNTRQIGIDEKGHAIPNRLIVDGQQRLTSLYAVFRGRKVLDENFKDRLVEIAFRPRDGKFEVADAAIRRDPEYIPNISDVWALGRSSRKIVNEFLANLSAKAPLTEDEEEAISHNLDRLFDLQKYPFTALEIAPTVEEEQVADIFVRINSEGVKLNQADFILTLLSVFWEDGRKTLERFCRDSRQAPTTESAPTPFNHFIQPDPDQLLRVAIALGFKRGRMKSVYQVLRGKDLETGEFSSEMRAVQFDILKEAQAHVLNLTHWHQFLNALVGAGFRGSEMVSSQTAILYSYAFYLIGKIQFGVQENVLQRVIGRWFFAVTLTGHYSGSPETVVESELNRFKGVLNADGYVSLLEEIMANTLTNDYWQTSLPADLESSSPRSPQYFAFVAAQNRLGAPVLFSHRLVSEVLDPSLRMKKKPLEKHHLYPKAWLMSQGVRDARLINQLANLTLIEWPENIEISDDPPAEYVPKLKNRFQEDMWSQMHELHALPADWQAMEYESFLASRRALMAAVIRRGFEVLKSPVSS